MNPQKDYYSTLGVLRSAEQVVIRAAYRALAQKYHPDKNPQSTKESSQKFIEIQEAYDTLSDEGRRRTYDEARGESNSDISDFFENNTSSNENDDPIFHDWFIASKYYPELLVIDQHLSRISRKLSYSFKAYIISEKLFSQGKKIAEELEINFLKQFFGENRKILSFAQYLISGKNIAAINELNETIRILGESCDPEIIIKKISMEHNIESHISTNQKQLIDFVRSRNWAGAKELLSKGVHAQDLRTEHGQTLIELARQQYDMQMIDLLQSHGFS